MLTRKQKNFADELLNNPKQSATRAVLKTYDTSSQHTAEQIAYENLRKPDVVIYLKNHVDKAKNRVVKLIDSEKEDIALRASESVLDRALGKPVQRSEVHASSVNLNLSLTDITTEVE